MTVNEREMTGELPLYRQLGLRFVQLVDNLRASDTGVDLSTSVLGETHLTGLQASFLSFMRACYRGTP